YCQIEKSLNLPVFQHRLNSDSFVWLDYESFRSLALVFYPLPSAWPDSIQTLTEGSIESSYSQASSFDCSLFTSPSGIGFRRSGLCWLFWFCHVWLLLQVSNSFLNHSS